MWPFILHPFILGKGALVREVRNILSRPGKIASAVKIKNLMHKAKPSRGYDKGQHDVPEFITDLVHELDNEYTNSYRGISDLLETLISEKLECNVCNKTSNNILRVLVHALPVHKGTLDDAWKSYMAPENLTCETCGNNSKTKTHKIIHKPKVFTAQVIGPEHDHVAEQSAWSPYQ